MHNRSQDGHRTVFLGEAGALLQSALERLRVEHPDDYQVLELRIMDNHRRKDVAEMLGTSRLADVNECVDAAKRFLVAALPPLADLI